MSRLCEFLHKPSSTDNDDRQAEMGRRDWIVFTGLKWIEIAVGQGGTERARERNFIIV